MATKKASKSGKKALLIAVVVLFLLLAALPTAMLLAIGMAPTVVALIIDMTPGRYLTRCVAGMNVAGVLPFLHKLWVGGHSMGHAFAIVTDVYAWLVIYSAAGIGWLLFLGLPGAVTLFRQLDAKRRIYVLRERQKALHAEWGDSILGAGEARRPPADADAAEAKPQDPAKKSGASALEAEMSRRATPAAGR